VLVEADERQHRRGDRAHAAEDVERYARSGALCHRTQRLRQLGGVDVAGEQLVRIVDAEHGVQIVIPGVAQHLEVAVDRAGQVEGVNVLRVGALPRFDQAPCPN
jgi:hypothetical protein